MRLSFNAPSKAPTRHYALTSFGARPVRVAFDEALIPTNAQIDTLQGRQATPKRDVVVDYLACALCDAWKKGRLVDGQVLFTREYLAERYRLNVSDSDYVAQRLVNRRLLEIKPHGTGGLVFRNPNRPLGDRLANRVTEADLLKFHLLTILSTLKNGDPIPVRRILTERITGLAAATGYSVNPKTVDGRIGALLRSLKGPIRNQASREGLDHRSGLPGWEIADAEGIRYLLDDQDAFLGDSRQPTPLAVKVGHLLAEVGETITSRAITDRLGVSPLTARNARKTILQQ